MMLSEINRFARIFHEVFSRKNFQLTFAEMNREVFGNFFVIFQSDSLSLIFVGDRGQIFVDVAGRDPEKNRRELNRALHRIDRSVPTTSDLNLLAAQLKIHYDEVVKLINGSLVLEDAWGETRKFLSGKSSGEAPT